MQKEDVRKILLFLAIKEGRKSRRNARFEEPLRYINSVCGHH